MFKDARLTIGLLFFVLSCISSSKSSVLILWPTLRWNTQLIKRQLKNDDHSAKNTTTYSTQLLIVYSGTPQNRK